VTRAETFHISIGAVVGAILMLAALLLYGIGIIYFPFVAPPSGSPYVRGGSIRGVTNPSWTKCDGTVCDVESGYWTTVTDPTQLVLSSVGNGVNNISGLKGWTVNFYDRSSDGSVNKDAAVQLCSEKTCKASGLDPAKSVYLRTPRPQDAFQVHKDQLRFHNHSDKKCDIDNSKEGYCDHVVMVGIIQNNGTTVLPEVQYTCGGWLSSGRCKVGFP